MHEAVIEPTFESWQERARAFLLAGAAPEGILWTVRGEAAAHLPIATEPPPRQTAPGRVRVPKRFVELARIAAGHRAADRWHVLYRVLWRISRDGARVLDDPLDVDMARLHWMVQQVRHDMHRMQAFVRFRQVGRDASERYVAWYHPDHNIAALVAPHFAERYGQMRWSLFTPQLTVHWDATELSYSPGVPVTAFPAADTEEEAEALWRTYYGALFNPARVNEAKLGRDVPLRFRERLPEARAIPSLILGARKQADALRAATGGATRRGMVPLERDLTVLGAAARTCQSCTLHACATQTVFGEGHSAAELMLVGEQPGDAEDVHGRPFVGPAGEVLDRALGAAGIERSNIYLTNAVKHFGFEPRGKWRIHRTPRISEIMACRPWLEAEIETVKPRVVLCLGAIAARSLLGPQARISALRGQVLSSAWAPALLVSYHPSAVLRAPEEQRDALFSALVADLTRAAGMLDTPVSEAPLSPMNGSR